MSLDLDQFDLVSADPEAALQFYRHLGVDIPDDAIWRTDTGIHHIDVTLPSGVILHIDSVPLADHYDTGWNGQQPTGPSIILNFKVGDRPHVDDLYERMVEHGYPAAQPPYDTFWGARYAIVIDPDGNHIGIMSPSDRAVATAPPSL
ncbi:MAG: VOC family protein [Acidimicrobiia bacterium]